MPRAARNVEIQPVDEPLLIEEDEFFGQLDDDDATEPDPAPRRTRTTRTRSAVSAGGVPKVTAAARRKVEEEVTGAAKLIAELWEMRDAHCGRVAVDQHAALAAAVSDWICDHPAWVASIVDAGQSVKTFRIVKEAWPILAAVYVHHIGKQLGEPAPEEWAGVPNDFVAPRF